LPANIEDLLSFGTWCIELDPSLHEADGEVEAEPHEVDGGQGEGGAGWQHVACRDDALRAKSRGRGSSQHEDSAHRGQGNGVGTGLGEEEAGDRGLGLDVVFGFFFLVVVVHGLLLLLVEKGEVNGSWQRVHTSEVVAESSLAGEGREGKDGKEKMKERTQNDASRVPFSNCFSLHFLPDLLRW